MNHLTLLSAATAVGLQAVASGVVGLAVTWFTWWLFRVLQTEDLEQGAEWRYDVTRINELRRIDLLYRVFQPAIQILARFNRAVFRDNLPLLQQELQAAGLPRYWMAEEYLARIELLSLFLIPLFVYCLFDLLGGAGVLLALLGVLGIGWLLRRLITHKSRMRLQQIKRRMPFLLDLLTLLMEAGATFLGALAQAVEEFRGHPVAEEFGRVLVDMNLGKTRNEAFQALRDRLRDDEITHILGSIMQAENLGTPLGRIFRTQADVLRIKRTQRAEALAGEAGVNMLLPGLLVMIATVLVILGPFLLNYLEFGMTF
jgi:tight adherence protein C